jgi:hypothetical protein
MAYQALCDIEKENLATLALGQESTPNDQNGTPSSHDRESTQKRAISLMTTPDDHP